MPYPLGHGRKLAVGVGFEPTVTFPPRRFSKTVPYNHLVTPPKMCPPAQTSLRLFVPSVGIEPTYQDPQSCGLSISLRGPTCEFYNNYTLYANPSANGLDAYLWGFSKGKCFCKYSPHFSVKLFGAIS